MKLLTKLVTSKLGIFTLKKYAVYKQGTVIIVLKERTILIQKNGSVIITLPSTPNGTVRGRRANVLPRYDDIDILDREEFDRVISEFIKKEIK